MPTFPKSPPDTPDHLAGFTIGAAISEDTGAPVVALTFSVAVVSLAGRTHQMSGDLRQYLTAPQQANFETVTLALYAKAKADLLT